MKKKRMVEVIDIWCDQCGGRLKPYAFNYSGYGKDFCSNGCVYQYEREHPIVRDIEFIEAFDNLITNGMEEVAGLKDFKADFGFSEPIRTKTECSNPEFHDHKLHRVAIMKNEHFGSKGDRDEGGVAGWTSKLVCVGCGMEFQVQKGFYLDKQDGVNK